MDPGWSLFFAFVRVITSQLKNRLASDDGMDLVDLPCLGDLGCPLTM